MLQEHRGGEPCFPDADRVLGEELAHGPGCIVGLSLSWGCEAQRVESLPVSGSAEMLAQIHAALNFWITRAV